MKSKKKNGIFSQPNKDLMRKIGRSWAREPSAINGSKNPIANKKTDILDILWQQGNLIYTGYAHSHSRSVFQKKPTWWFIPLSKWVLTPVISGLTLLIPFITGVITHLLSGMSHQVVVEGYVVLDVYYEVVLFVDI